MAPSAISPARLDFESPAVNHPSRAAFVSGCWVLLWDHESDVEKSRKITRKVASADTCFIALLFHVITPLNELNTFECNK